MGLNRTDWILFLWAPLVLGTLWGAWQGRRDRFSIAVLLAAPISSTVLIVVGMMAVEILRRILFGGPPFNPNNTDLLTFVAVMLATPFLYGFGLLCFGAVPAFLGSTAGQLVKLCIWRIRSRVSGPSAGDHAAAARKHELHG
jgi:hypothetical protein